MFSCQRRRVQVFAIPDVEFIACECEPEEELRGEFTAAGGGARVSCTKSPTRWGGCWFEPTDMMGYKDFFLKQMVGERGCYKTKT